MAKLDAPFTIFNDLRGLPLDAGYIYIGEANKDSVAYPVAVYSDPLFQFPVSQPIRTSKGYVVLNGTPINLYINVNYSMMVQDSQSRLICNVPFNSIT